MEKHKLGARFSGYFEVRFDFADADLMLNELSEGFDRTPKTHGTPMICYRRRDGPGTTSGVKCLDSKTTFADVHIDSYTKHLYYSASLRFDASFPWDAVHKFLHSFHCNSGLLKEIWLCVI